MLPIGDNLERVSVRVPGPDTEVPLTWACFCPVLCGLLGFTRAVPPAILSDDHGCRMLIGASNPTPAPDSRPQAWADELLAQSSAAAYDAGVVPQTPALAAVAAAAAAATSAAAAAVIATAHRHSPVLPTPSPPPSIERITLLLRVSFHELVLPASSDAALFSVDRASKHQCDPADGSPARDPFDASVREDPARLIFGRLRALRHATACMRASEPLPWAICYTAVPEDDTAPQHALFAMTDHVASGGHRVRTHPSLQCDVIGVFKKGTDVFCAVRALENEDGRWLQLTQLPEPATQGFDANSGYHEACRKVDDGPWMLAASRTPGGVFLTWA